MHVASHLGEVSGLVVSSVWASLVMTEDSLVGSLDVGVLNSSSVSCVSYSRWRSKEVLVGS